MDLMVRLIAFPLEIFYYFLDCSFVSLVWDLVCLGNKYIHVVWRMSLTFASVLTGVWRDAPGDPDTQQRSCVFLHVVLGFHCRPDDDKPAVGARPPKRKRALGWVRCDVYMYAFKWEMKWKLSPTYFRFVFPTARLFHQAFISFRNYIMQSHSLDVDIHIILNDICFSAGKCVET